MALYGHLLFCPQPHFVFLSVVQDTILMMDIKYQQIFCRLLPCRKLGLHIEFTVSYACNFAFELMTASMLILLEFLYWTHRMNTG